MKLARRRCYQPGTNISYTLDYPASCHGNSDRAWRRSCATGTRLRVPWRCRPPPPHERLHFVVADPTVEVLQFAVSETKMRHKLRQPLANDLVVFQFSQLIGVHGNRRECYSIARDGAMRYTSHAKHSHISKNYEHEPKEHNHRLAQKRCPRLLPPGPTTEHLVCLTKHVLSKAFGLCPHRPQVPKCAAVAATSEYDIRGFTR